MTSIAMPCDSHTTKPGNLHAAETTGSISPKTSNMSPLHGKRINRDIVVAECVEREKIIEEAFEERFLTKFGFCLFGITALIITMRPLENGISSAPSPILKASLAFLITFYRSRSLCNATRAAVRWTAIYCAVSFTQQCLSSYLRWPKAFSADSGSSWDITRSPDGFLLLLTNLSVWLLTAYLSELCPVDWAQLLEYIEPNSSNEDLEEVSASSAPLIALFLPSWVGFSPKMDTYDKILRSSYLSQLLGTPLRYMRAGLIVHILSFIMMNLFGVSENAMLESSSFPLEQQYTGLTLKLKCNCHQPIYQMIYRESLGLRLAMLVWVTSFPLIVYRAWSWKEMQAILEQHA